MARAHACPAPLRTARRGTVVCYTVECCGDPSGHEAVTRTRIAERIAALLGCEAGGEYAPDDHASPLYFVPDRTLTRTHALGALGAASEHDLFGGIVPHEHVATKTITHPLLGAQSDAPAGWSHAFGERVREAVLEGYSAYSLADARIAARRLLDRGAVRLKRACETGGRGQYVAQDMKAVEAALAQIEPREVERGGLVIEQNLEAVDTLSVGQVHIGEWRASYYGVQRLTADHAGEAVYGGSTLHVVRGGYDALLGRAEDPAVRTAVMQARVYEDAALACFDGFCASRRNYDVAQGVDGSGRRCSGVLEQSWRIGGASGAEILAVEALAGDPDLAAVDAACTEVYGDGPAPPEATVYFDGDDPRVGRILKYAVVKRA